MARLPVHQLDTQADPLDMGTAQVYHLPDWHKLSHPERLVVIRKVAEARGRDMRIARLAVSILRKAGARPRQYERQAAALLRWVQDPENVYYVNEPSERLQDPLFTLKVRMGDCDDQVILLCCLFESIRLSWKLCLAGVNVKTGEKVRYIEGQPVPPDCAWTHIFCMVATPPFKPKHWYWCETTVEGVPLGWDVKDGDRRYLPKGLPEMQSAYKGTAKIVGSLADQDFGQMSALMPLAVGVTLAESDELYYDDDDDDDDDDDSPRDIDWAAVRRNIGIGVTTAVGTTLVLMWINNEGIWKKTGYSLPRLIGLELTPLKGETVE